MNKVTNMERNSSEKCSKESCREALRQKEAENERLRAAAEMREKERQKFMKEMWEIAIQDRKDALADRELNRSIFRALSNARN